jgi:hypothetical protein
MTDAHLRNSLAKAISRGWYSAAALRMEVERRGVEGRRERIAVSQRDRMEFDEACESGTFEGEWWQWEAQEYEGY